MTLHAADLGVRVVYGDYPAASLYWDEGGPKLIFIPERYGGFRRAWALAHELGHLHHDHWFWAWREEHEMEADDHAITLLTEETDPGVPLWQYHQTEWPSGETVVLSEEIRERSRNM